MTDDEKKAIHDAVLECLQEKLSVQVSCDYGGDVDVSVYFDGEYICGGSDSVIVERNPAEE